MAEKNGDDEIINLQILGRDYKVFKLKMKKNSHISEFFTEYCKRIDILFETVCFVFNGRRITENDTPASLEMEENDVIEVYY